MEQIKESLKRYVEDRIPTGGFLRAVLENDLFTASSKADFENRYQLHEICNYIYNNLPSKCWGDKKTVEQWLQNKA